MVQVRLKFRPGLLWLFAAAVISAVEIHAAGGRIRSNFRTEATSTADFLSSPQVKTTRCDRELGVVGESTECGGDAILVLENLAPVLDGDIEVTISAHRIPRGLPRSDDFDRMAEKHLPSVTPYIRVVAEKRCSVVPDDHNSVESSRVFFLQSSIRPTGNDAGHVAISSRAVARNSHARIYVDDHVRRDESLNQLIQAIDDASSSELGERVQGLVGPVRDVDHDGRLAIVVTPAVANLGTGQTPVDGLTRPADFVPGLDRPESNNSDVIFLSSHLRPGDQLQAVLAHEWCHAAVFSQRMCQLRRTEEDWLNEAIAHVVEVQASGSRSNLSHRIQEYRSSPHRSPLVVPDYYRPDFWRHDGCRGAAYLFLNWCQEQADDRLLERLVHSDRRGIESLETAMGRSFPDLFHAWSVSQARALARREAVNRDSVVTPHVWRLSSDSTTLTMRMSGTSAAYVWVESRSCEETWSLTTIRNTADSLRATMIPVK